MSHPYSDTTLLGAGTLLVAICGYELFFAYKTGTVHRARDDLGPISRKENPAAFWRNVYGAIFLMLLGIGVATIGAIGMITGHQP